MAQIVSPARGSGTEGKLADPRNRDGKLSGGEVVRANPFAGPGPGHSPAPGPAPGPQLVSQSVSAPQFSSVQWLSRVRLFATP